MKKSQKKDSPFDFVKGILSGIAEVGTNAIIGNLRPAATETMEEAQRRIQEATVKALKAATIFIIMIFGLILVIVGIGTYLSNTVPALNYGLGYVLIGGVLMGLGLLIQFFKN